MFEFQKTNLEGVIVVRPQIFQDHRGPFFESYQKEKFVLGGISTEFVQDNQSTSVLGTIRGLHFQKGEHAQAKLVRVIFGEVLDVAVDLRPYSRTFGQHYCIKLNSENCLQLFIPRGFAHGFSVLSEKAIFTYKCDNYYSPQHEGGLLYNDPELKIDWLLEKNLHKISTKDGQYPKLSDLNLSKE